MTPSSLAHLHERMRLTMFRSLLAALVAATVVAPDAHTQEAPLRGPRKIDPRWHALVGARLIPEPGTVLENATLVLRDGVIEEIRGEL